MSEYKPTNLYFTAHHNWSWVLDAAIASFGGDVSKVPRMHLLPSQHQKKVPRSYALFRVEATNENGVSSIVWCTSAAFAFLDPKDSLFCHLMRSGAEKCMPQTHLISWDSKDIGIAPNRKMLLKAALGSGGDSLYFVSNKDQVLHIIRTHADKARSTPNFKESLMETYGRIPYWSLQELLTSFLPGMNQKCQIRAYVIAVGQHLYLYKSYEVRFPYWREDHCASPSPYVSADLEFCGESGATPYNANRSKASTERYVLSEVCFDDTIQNNITNTIHFAFNALKDKIKEKMDEDNRLTVEQWGAEFCPPPTLVAVAGVDLLLDGVETKIVELNNNPAMPQAHKHMSDSYRGHIIDMVHDIIKLGMGCDDCLRFENIW